MQSFEVSLTKIIGGHKPYLSYLEQIAKYDENTQVTFREYLRHAFYSGQASDLWNEYIENIGAYWNDNDAVQAKIQGIEPWDYATLRHSEEMNKIEEDLEKRDRQKNKDFDDEKFDILSLNNKLLIIYFLNKHGYIKLNKISQDFTKRAKLLSPLLGRDYDNLRKVHAQIENKERYFTKERLTVIKKMFEEASLSEIVEDIETRISGQSDLGL